MSYGLLPPGGGADEPKASRGGAYNDYQAKPQQTLPHASPAGGSNNSPIPILGVCLGHQVIAQVFGGKIVRAPEPVHGKTSDITHTNQGVFQNLSNPFEATRYHSLIVERESLPDCFTITAETKDGIIMGLQHKEYPLHGVQFHPESIASQYGHAILKNFLTLSGIKCSQ